MVGIAHIFNNIIQFGVFNQWPEMYLMEIISCCIKKVNNKTQTRNKVSSRTHKNEYYHDVS